MNLLAQIHRLNHKNVLVFQIVFSKRRVRL